MSVGAEAPSVMELTELAKVTVGAVSVSAKGKKVIQKMAKGEKVEIKSSGLSKREWNELMTSFEFKDKLV